MTVDVRLDELLVAHAAGRLAEPVALAVATHLALSPPGRARFAFYEALGGVLLDGIEPEPVAPGAWARLLEQLSDVEPGGVGQAAIPGDHRLPPPLWPYAPEGLAGLRWKRYGPVSEADLKIRDGGFRAKLVRLKAGRRVPRHTHAGQELTVVLEGAFTDKIGHYGRGDIAIADSSLDHQPTATADGDCLCLAVTDARLLLTGPVGRFLNPFLRF